MDMTSLKKNILRKITTRSLIIWRHVGITYIFSEKISTLYDIIDR